MATTIIITCPKCKKQLRGPSGFVGKSVRCKSCGHNFVVKASATAPAAASAPAPASAPSAKPAPERDKSMYEFADSDSQKKESRPGKTKPAPQPVIAAPRPPISGDGNALPYSLKDAELLTARCPQCARDFDSPEQVICLHCGYNTQTNMRMRTVRVEGTTPAEQTLWIVPGILCAIAVLLSLVLDGVLWLALDRYDADGNSVWWVFPLQVWGSVTCGFVCWYAGRFAYHRLVTQPKPPEKVKS
jgi:DNA-directed RNA polymerase subunit RPC12/RpoP